MAGRERAVSDETDTVRNRVTGLCKRIWIADKFFLRLVKQYAVNGFKNGIIGRYHNLCQIIAPAKRITAHFDYTIRDGDARERIARAERAIADGGHAFRDGDAREGVAPTKRAISDGGHTIRDGNAHKEAAGSECFVSDGGYGMPIQRIRNGQL